VVRGLNTGVLYDGFGRRIDYLRVSVTDRCNLRCSYCRYRDFEYFPKSEILTIEEIIELVDVFYREMGVRKVRITGGEPFLRNGIERLLMKLREYPVEVGITTNGVLLGKFVDVVRECGATVNVSLDTLTRDTFRTLNGGDFLDDVLRSIDKALGSNIKIKVNTVLLRALTMANYLT